MMSALARKLGHPVDLSQDDLNALARAIEHVHEAPAHKVLIEEGDRPEYVHVVLDGFAYRYKLLSNGARQIIAWLVPGDFCDLHVAVLEEMDHTIATASPSRIGRIPRAQVEHLTDTSPALSHAFQWASLVDAAILREWVVSLGRRDAEGRMAHLFCELHARIAAVDLVRGATVKLPLTQTELADTLGVTAVHVNRILQSLRERKLIRWASNSLVLEDIEALRELAGFDPNYLHLQRRSARWTAGAATTSMATEGRPRTGDEPSS